MAFSVISGVRLSALGVVVPSNNLSLHDELAHFDNNPEKARRMSELSGLATRRIAPPGVTAADLCADAAERLLEGRDKNGTGMIIFVSHSPDYMLPASASILQHRLDLPSSCGALDMNVGCAGFVNGLWMAASLIASGAVKKTLLLVGDTPARFADPDNRVVAPVFGDAGTAALLEAAPGEDMNFCLANDGTKHQALVIPGGGARIPFSAADSPADPAARLVRDGKNTPWTLGGYCRIWMDGAAIYSFGVSVVPRHIRKHLEKCGLATGAVRRLFLHQANKIMVEAIARKSGFSPEQTPFDCLGRYGNLGSSSIPAQMCAHFADGEREARQQVMLCAFGAGLAASSCILSLENTDIRPVREYSPPKNHPSRDDNIRHWHEKFYGKQHVNTAGAP
ncbi:MAG: ketoacyl-ACP synthase III [Desulfovibrio sp.]|nr:ketoacyl-ACP synthase III [Desulfovibrio sp.]